MQKHTSVQVPLPGISDQPCQSEMLAEWGTAPGAGGRKDALIDVNAIEKREEAKPLPGQLTLTRKRIEAK